MQTKSELAYQSLNQIFNSCWHWFKMGLIAGACMLATVQYAIRSLPNLPKQNPGPTVSTAGPVVSDFIQSGTPGPTLAAEIPPPPRLELFPDDHSPKLAK